MSCETYFDIIKETYPIAIYLAKQAAISQPEVCYKSSISIAITSSAKIKMVVYVTEALKASNIKTVLSILRITGTERMLGTGDATYILNPETLVRAHVTPDTSTVTVYIRLSTILQQCCTIPARWGQNQGAFRASACWAAL
jgi:hypothetical protein